MSKEVGLVSFPPDSERFNKPYSNKTAQLIDKEVRQIVDHAYTRVVDLLSEKKALVEKLALALLEKEVRVVTPRSGAAAMLTAASGKR